MIPANPTERFAALYEAEPMSGCWLWLAGCYTNSYGMFWDGEREVRAHRFAYERYRGPISAGLQLDHLCRVKVCVNPSHLEPVTLRENVRRGISPPAINAVKDTCLHGHPFTAVNTRIRPNDKGRRCLTCERDRDAGRRRSGKPAEGVAG
jgi:hypothetical protein